MRTCSVRGCDAPATSKATSWDSRDVDRAVDALTAAGMIAGGSGRGRDHRGPHIRILCDWHGQRYAGLEGWKVTGLQVERERIGRRQEIDIRGALRRLGKLPAARTED